MKMSADRRSLNFNSNKNNEKRLPKTSMKVKKSKLDSLEIGDLKSSPLQTRQQRLKKLQYILSKEQNAQQNIKVDNSRSTTFHFLIEPLNLFLIVISCTAVSFNLVNLLLLAYGLVLFKFSFNNTAPGLKRSYLISMIGVCLTIILIGLQVYSNIAVFVYYIDTINSDEIIPQLIKAIGITMHRSLSVSKNIGEGFKCYSPMIANLVAFCWLTGFYKGEKDAKNIQEDYSPPSGIAWFYTTKPWCYVFLISMFISACLNISISGLIFAGLGFYSFMQWVKDNSIEQSEIFYFSAVIGSCISGAILFISQLLVHPIITSNITNLLSAFETVGIQISLTSANIIGIFHHTMIVISTISGLLFIQMSKYHIEKIINSSPSPKKIPLLSPEKPSLLINTPRAERDEPHVDIQPLLSVRASAGFQPSFRFPTQYSDSSNVSPLKQIEKQKSFCTKLFDIFKEYIKTPQFFVIIAQALMFLWIIRFNSLWNIPQMIWLSYTTIYGTQERKFVMVTKYMIFPYMIVNTVFLYVVNIYYFPVFRSDLWKMLGILEIRVDEYTIYFFEFALMISTLVSLGVIIRYENEYKLSTKKESALIKLLSDHQTLKQIFVIIIKNLDKGIIILLYFQGLRAVNILHAGLVAYFLVCFIYPRTGRRCFVFLLAYVEMFLTLQIIYGVLSFMIMDSEYKGTIETIGVIIGVYAELFSDTAVGRVNIQPTIIILVILIFFQYKLYGSSLYNQTEDTNSYKISQPTEEPHGFVYFLLFIRNCASWLYIWVAYIVFMIIIITQGATLINAIFLILILVASTLHMWNEDFNTHNGSKHTRQIWIILVLYCGIIVLTLYVFQFFGIRILKMFLEVFYLPKQFTENVNVIGYEQFKDDDRWLSFFPYFVLLFLSVIASRQVYNVSDDEGEDTDNLIQIPDSQTVGIDSAYFLKKLRFMWGLFDFISANMFDILAFVMLTLTIFWNLSLASCVLMMIICGYYFSLHKTAYLNSVFNYGQRDKIPNLSEAQTILETEYKNYRGLLINTRKKYWKILYIAFIVCFIICYMSRFIEIVYFTQLPYSNDVYNTTIWFKFIRFISTWAGFYHGEITSPSSFAKDSLGYFLLFILLIFEGKSIQWYYNRMDIENEITRNNDKNMKKNQQDLLQDDTGGCIPIDEFIENSMMNLPENNPSINSPAQNITFTVNESDFGKELFKSLLVTIAVQYYKLVYKGSNVMNYYKYLPMKALKNFLENAILFLAIMTCVLKENGIVFLYVPVLFIYLKFGSSTKLNLCLLHYFMILYIFQYLICIVTFSTKIAPQSENYPFIDTDCNSMLDLIGISAKCPFYLNLHISTDLANYIALGDSSKKLQFSFIDVITLMLFSFYFRYFCNPIYENDIINTEQNENSQSNQQQQNIEESQLIDETPVSGSLGLIQSKALESRKKRKSFLKSFCGIAENFLFYYLHVFILFIILILATRSESLASIPYLIFCLIFLYHNRQFAVNKKAWMYPPSMRYFLHPYLFIDIIFQFLLQSPFKNSLSESDWYTITIIQRAENSTTIILKLMIFAMVSLQAKIFQSGEFTRFTEQNTIQYIETSQFKGLCCTYLYNNKRVFRYKKYEQQKEKHSEKLEQIKEQIEEWNKKLNNPEAMRGFMQLRRLTSFRRSSIKSTITDLPRSPRKDDIDTSKRLAQIQQSLDDDKMLRKEAIKNFVGPLGRFYIWLHSMINHVLFKKGEKLDALFDAAERGSCDFLSRLEKMAVACERTRLLLEKDKLEAKLGTVQEEEAKMQDEKSRVEFSNEKLVTKFKKLKDEIASFCKFGHILKHYWLCCYRIILSSTQFYCYFVMILAHLFQGSILSVVYPVSIFIYGLTEHCRPRRGYWIFVLIYAELVLALKFCIQLNAIDDWIKTFNEKYFMSSARLGLKIHLSTRSADFFYYILFECLIILSTLLHQYVLIFLGIYDKREIEHETIEAAIDRICNKGDISENQDDKSEGKNEDEKGQQRTYSFPEKPLDNDTSQNMPGFKEQEKDISVIPMKKLRTNTLLSDDLLESPAKLKRRELGSQIKKALTIQVDPDEKRQETEEKTENIVESTKTQADLVKNRNAFIRFLAWIGFENSYVRTLFPRLKIEKPGVDYSNRILYIQLLIAIFIILFYARMNADYENVSQAFSYFFQIAIRKCIDLRNFQAK